MVFISAALVRVSLLSYYGCKTRVRVLLSTLLTFSVVYEVVANQIVWASRAWMLCILADPGPRPPTPTSPSAPRDTPATEATSAAAARLFGLVFAQAILTALKTFFTTLLALAFRTALVGNLTHRYYQKLDGCGQTDGAEVGETVVQLQRHDVASGATTHQAQEEQEQLRAVTTCCEEVPPRGSGQSSQEKRRSTCEEDFPPAQVHDKRRPTCGEDFLPAQVDHRLCEDARLFSAGLPQMVVSLLIVPCALCYYSARLAAYDIHGSAAPPVAPYAAPSTSSEHQEIVHRREHHQWGAPPTTSPESSVGGWLPLLVSHLAPAKAFLVRHLGSLFSPIHTCVPNKLMLCVLLALYAYFAFFTAVGAFLTHLTTPKRERVQFLEGRLRALHVRQRACRDEIALLDGGASAERAEHRRAFSHTLLPALGDLVGYQDGALSFFQSLFAYLGTPVCYFAVGVAFLSVVGNNTPSETSNPDHDTPQDRYGKISAGVLSALMVLKSMTDLVQLFKTATDVGGYARRIDELVGDLFERTTLASHKNLVADLERSELAEEDDNIFPFAPFIQVRSARKSCVSNDFDSESSSPGTSGGLSTWWRLSTRGRSLLRASKESANAPPRESSIEMTTLALNTTQRREQARNAKEPLLREDERGAQDEQDLLLRVGSASAGATASAAAASLASARNSVPRGHTSTRKRDDLHEDETPLLQLDNVTLRAPGRPPGGVVLLKELSFQVFRRKHLLVKGPSGCGKSTLVKALAFGHYEGANDLLRSPGSFCKVLTLPQKPYIFPARCLLEVVFYGLDSTEHRRRATRTSSDDQFIHRSPEIAELVHRAKQSFVLMATSTRGALEEQPGCERGGFDSASLAAWLLFYVRKLKLQPLFMRFCISRRGREDGVGEVAAEREQEGDAEIDFPRLLSPGEAQRIAALRVLLRLRLYEGLRAQIRAAETSMDVLVLVDEGSSHLDEDGEAALYEELCAVGGAGAAVGGQQSTVSVTLVSFSHRVQTLRPYHDGGILDLEPFIR